MSNKMVPGGQQPSPNRRPVTVNAEQLEPMLGLSMKFFQSITHTRPTRTGPGAHYTLDIRTEGFSPSDFSALQSLVNTLGTDQALREAMKGTIVVDGQEVIETTAEVIDGTDGKLLTKGVF